MIADRIPQTAQAMPPDILAALNHIAAQISASANAVPLDKKLVDKAWLADYLGVSQSTVNRYTARQDWPKPVKLEGGALRWVAGEVIDWVMKQRRV